MTAQDAQRADQIATELAVEGGVLRARLPAESADRRANQLPDRVAEPFPWLAVQEPIAPGEPEQHRLPHRRGRLIGEAEDQIQEGAHGCTTRDHPGPGGIDQALALRRRELHHARHETPAELVVVEGADERRAVRVRDEERIGVGQRNVQPVRLDEHSRCTSIAGYPGWKIQASMMRRTGCPVSASSASQRWWVSVLPYACVAR